MVYMVTFTINIPPMLAYIPYMDPMGYDIYILKKKNKTNKAKSTEIGDRKVTANNYRKTRV